MGLKTGRFVWISALFAGATGSACTPPDADSEWAGTITEVDGVTVVANPTEGMWEEEEEWTFEEMVRIGTIAGDPDYQFGEVGSVAVADDGSIHVFDTRSLTVKTFSGDGTHLRTFGRGGNGPGEIGTGATDVLTAGGDTLMVPDPTNQRINLYTSDGNSAGSLPLPLSAGLTLIWRTTSSGRIVRQIRPINLQGPDDSAEATDVIVAQTAGSTQLDTLLRMPSGGSLNLSGASSSIVLFAPEPVWAVTDDLSVWYGMSDDFSFHLYRDGQLVRTFTKPFTQQPVTETAKRRAREEMLQLWRDAGVPSPSLALLADMIGFGDSFPAFSAVFVGPSGTIWVQHAVSAETVFDEQAVILDIFGIPDWDVFDEEGRFLGTVTMPERFSPRLFDGDRIYGVWADELDVQYVLVLRIVGATAA